MSYLYHLIQQIPWPSMSRAFWLTDFQSRATKYVAAKPFCGSFFTHGWLVTTGRASIFVACVYAALTFYILDHGWLVTTVLFNIHSTLERCINILYFQIPCVDVHSYTLLSIRWQQVCCTYCLYYFIANSKHIPHALKDVLGFVRIVAQFGVFVRFLDLC